MTIDFHAYGAVTPKGITVKTLFWYGAKIQKFQGKDTKRVGNFGWRGELDGRLGVVGCFGVIRRWTQMIVACATKGCPQLVPIFREITQINCLLIIA
ncbi:MAG: hypothetical protein R6U65_07670, partial [Perlabentimonas sp.]